MHHPNAILIQDIQDYNFLLNDYLNTILEFRFLNKASRDKLLKWIIAEELELIYGVFTHDHIHNEAPFENIHNKLSCKINISEITRFYIKAPKFTNYENRVLLKVNGRDLLLEYFRDNSNKIF